MWRPRSILDDSNNLRRRVHGDLTDQRPQDCRIGVQKPEQGAVILTPYIGRLNGPIIRLTSPHEVLLPTCVYSPQLTRTVWQDPDP